MNRAAALGIPLAIGVALGAGVVSATGYCRSRAGGFDFLLKWSYAVVARSPPVVARSPDRATGPTEGLLFVRGDLRSGQWSGQETRPQRESLAGASGSLQLNCGGV